MVTEVKYSMGFIGGALLYPESLKVARIYAELQNWHEVSEAAFSNNVLQARTQKSARRILNEIITRLQVLNQRELELFLEGTKQEQIHILWLATCKRYLFVHDFAVEVLREKFVRHDLHLSPQDCDTFLNAKAEWHDEVDRLTRTTREKIRQILMKLLREAELINNQNSIIPVLLSERFIATISSSSKQSLNIFPVDDVCIARSRH